MIDIKTFEELTLVADKTGKKIYEIAQEIEAKSLEISVEDVRFKVKNTLNEMKNAINRGLYSEEPSFSKMVGTDCKKLKERYKNHNTLFCSAFQKILLYAFATIEENSRMGKIVACPTAGSCGIVPAVLIALAESMHANEEKQINALITAGFIGKVISNKMALAGAVMGCQGECGVASAMAAASVIELSNGSISQTLNAAALALKNVMGLVCDPVAGLVEVPCVKRNPFLAMHATVAAELAQAGIESIIPIDEVVDATRQVGQLMSVSLKESSEAGLARTKTGIRIAESLKNQ